MQDRELGMCDLERASERHLKHDTEKLMVFGFLIVQAPWKAG